jgi:hypothetical protein
MSKEIQFGAEKSICPHCGVVSQQNWFMEHWASEVAVEILDNYYYNYRKGIRDYAQEYIEKFLVGGKKVMLNELDKFIPSRFAVSTCISCSDIALWIDEEIVFPRKMQIDEPNDDLNDEIKAIYSEAAQILLQSPKGAAALLRLALQRLLLQLGKEGKNINNDIKSLVSEGLSPTIQQALDIMRVVGNNAVHPGQIDFEDNKNVALQLFKILNLIAYEMITKPNEMAKLYEDIIPEETKEHIRQRDETG